MTFPGFRDSYNPGVGPYVPTIEDLKAENASLKKEVEELRVALREIGNAIGGPTMSYAPEIERREFLTRILRVAELVRKAFSLDPGAGDEKEGSK